MQQTPLAACVKMFPTLPEQKDPMQGRTDFFIAGSPKCGTTALFEYLSAHPDVFIPTCKEPGYFCSDIDTGGPRTLKAYQALYSAAPAQARTGDASVMYMYSEVAIAQLMAHNPAAKVIVMLRHPVEAARSLYGALLSHGHENAATFEQAWRLQRARLGGAGLPPRWPEAKTLQYGPIFRYAPQLRRLIAEVPRAQYLVLQYEEFFAEPAQHFAQVLRFLELSPDPARNAFPVINPTLRARSGALQRFLNRPPPWLKAVGGPLRSVAHAAGLHPLGALQRFNRVAGAKPGISPAFREELEAYFAADVAETEQLLGRKLWPRRADPPG